MNCTELKVARMRRNITGKEASKVLGLTIDGYFKKEHGDARITLDEALALTKYFKLTYTEFVQIFFDGDLPLLYLDEETCSYKGAQKPLKEARLHTGLTVEEAAIAIGVSYTVYSTRENSTVRCTLEQAKALAKLFELTYQSFNDIFFKSELPFCKNDVVTYNNIVKQFGGEINA